MYCDLSVDIRCGRVNIKPHCPPPPGCLGGHSHIAVVFESRIVYVGYSLNLAGHNQQPLELSVSKFGKI